MGELVDHAGFAHRAQGSVHGRQPDSVAPAGEPPMDHLGRRVVGLRRELGEHGDAIAARLDPGRGQSLRELLSIGYGRHRRYSSAPVRTRIILITVLVLVGAGVAFVLALDDGERSSATSGTPEQVVAGFYPLALAAQEVGGPDLEVDNLTPPGVEPHDLEVSSNDVRALQSADLVLLMGKDFQPQLEEAAGRGDSEVIELLDTPGLDVHANDDPHVWLDPVRYEKVVRRVAEALGDERAAAPMVRRLHALDRDYGTGLAHCRRHDIVTSHEAFAYLADRYGLRQIAVLGLSPEAEPSPGQLSRVIDRVRASNATMVFGEELLSPKLTDTVARETGAGTAILNPIEALTAKQEDRGEDYFTLMRRNLAALRKGLGCR
jgi:zinc transport system substrate-binding protein